MKYFYICLQLFFIFNCSLIVTIFGSNFDAVLFCYFIVFTVFHCLVHLRCVALSPIKLNIGLLLSDNYEFRQTGLDWPGKPAREISSVSYKGGWEA